MRRKQIFWSVAALVIIIIIFYSIHEYSRTVANPTDVFPEEKITAVELAKAFAENEVNADNKYSGKVIQVSGSISSFYNEGDTLVQVVLNTVDTLPKISCSIAASQFPAIKKYSVNQPITMKGYCTGYLLDVKLNMCVIVK